MPLKSLKNLAEAEHDRPLEESKVRELVAKRCGEIRSFLTAIKDPSMIAMLEDEHLFATLLALAINDYGVRTKDLATALSVSVPQVGRWAAGENAPRPYARAQVVQGVAHLLEKALTELEQRTAA